MLTEQREEMREALKRHGDQAARPVLVYPQLEKLSTAWKLGLPGPTGLTPAVFKEVMALHKNERRWKARTQQRPDIKRPVRENVKAKNLQNNIKERAAIAAARRTGSSTTQRSRH